MLPTPSHSNAALETEEHYLRLHHGHYVYIRNVSCIATPSHSRKDLILVVVHGGPGLSTHAELLPAFILAIFDMSCVNRCVFYDQLGCGKSDKPMNSQCYTLDSFVLELMEVIVWAAGNLPSRVCVLGHSWGGQLVLEMLFKLQFNMKFGYVFDFDKCISLRNNYSCETTVLAASALVGAIVSNAALDSRTAQAKRIVLHEALDDSIRNFIEQEEQEQSRNYSCESLVYSTLIGDSDRSITGEMACWSALSRMNTGEFKCLCRCVPCLLISGNYDNIPFEEYTSISSDTVKAIILPDSEHAPFFERSSKVLYFQYLNLFFESLPLR